MIPEHIIITLRKFSFKKGQSASSTKKNSNKNSLFSLKIRVRISQI